MSHILGPFIGHLLGPFLDWLFALIAGGLSLAFHVILSALMMAVKAFLDLPLIWQLTIYFIGSTGITLEASSTEETPLGAGLIEEVQGIEGNGINRPDLDALFGKVLGLAIVYPLVGWGRLLQVTWEAILKGCSAAWDRLVEADWVSLSLFSGDIVSFSLSGVLSKLLRK